MKKIVSAVLVFVMMLSLAGCGISYDDIKGDWTAKTINGMTIDEYAASLGVDPSQATVNIMAQLSRQKFDVFIMN